MGSRNRHQKLKTVRRFYTSFSIKCKSVVKPLGNFHVFRNASTVLARQTSSNILCAGGAWWAETVVSIRKRRAKRAETVVNICDRRAKRAETVVNICDWRAKRAETVVNIRKRRAKRAETVVNICDRRAKRAETVVSICEQQKFSKPL